MTGQMNHHSNKNRGAVSIFIVIFSTLLISTVVVGFVRLMIHEQQQATAADLSQSALNSAQAGVEDAKRAIVRYSNYCMGSSAAMAEPECTRLSSALNTLQCNTIQRAGIAGSEDDKEVMVRQESNEADAQLQQAYTCVKVQLNTTDFIGELPAQGSRMIPLKGTGDFNKVEVEWFSQADLKSIAGDSLERVNLSDTADESLPRLGDWPSNRPALLRAQLIQFGNDFKLSDFDKTESGESNAHTLFLNPSRGGLDTFDFASDIRLSPTSGLLNQVDCDENFSTDTVDKQYACKATLLLPNAVGQGDQKRTAYLRLNGLYSDITSFRVKLVDDSSSIKFSSVQPVVDSTGRANDLFRRIQSRVEIDNSIFPFPQSSINLSSNLCKTFKVTDREEDFVAGTCSDT